MSTVAEELVLRVEDPGRELDGVLLRTDLFKRLPPAEFVHDGDLWTLHLPRPAAVDRMEYLLELVLPDGTSELVCDPTNPLTAPGPFGDKSVLEFPGYVPPAWIDDEEAPEGGVERLRLWSRTLRARVRGLLWSSPDAEPGAPLPLLVAHDGPEYAELSLLRRFLDFAAAEKELPPMRAALLAPVARDEHYSASARYSTALARDVLPALARRAPTPPERDARVGMGASLGALALLHAHRTHPETFGALFLQSGSFFRQRSDRQESAFTRFGRIARFMGSVLAAETWPDPVPVAITCGTGEENLANNQATAAALAAQGYGVDYSEHRDEHNWVSWRDAFDPHLLTLLQRVWG
ncbi:MAG: alpha/beta hydrolase [Gaiellaceae bacterium]